MRSPVTLLLATLALPLAFSPAHAGSLYPLGANAVIAAPPGDGWTLGQSGGVLAFDRIWDLPDGQPVRMQIIAALAEVQRGAAAAMGEADTAEMLLNRELGEAESGARTAGGTGSGPMAVTAGQTESAGRTWHWLRYRSDVRLHADSPVVHEASVVYFYLAPGAGGGRTVYTFHMVNGCSALICAAADTDETPLRAVIGSLALRPS